MATSRKSANKAAKTPVVSMRLPDEVTRRADALVEALAERDEFRAAAGGVTRSTVIRLAILRGLDALEAESRRVDSARARSKAPGARRAPRG